MLSPSSAIHPVGNLLMITMDSSVFQHLYRALSDGKLYRIDLKVYFGKQNVSIEVLTFFEITELEACQATV